MSVLYIVLPLALIVVGVAVAAFLWAAKRGQFDDLDTPAVRALHEDAPSGPKHSKRAAPAAPAGPAKPAKPAKEEHDRA